MKVFGFKKGVSLKIGVGKWVGKGIYKIVGFGFWVGALNRLGLSSLEKCR